MTEEVEVWKSIPAYQGYYEASTLGRIKSLPRIGTTIDGVEKFWKGRVLKPQKTNRKTGHLSVGLYQNGVSTSWSVHHLVLITFVGPCPFGMEARHFPDRDPTNNKLSNLQWGTPAENCADKIIHGTTNRGERNGHSVITDNQALEIRRLYKDDPTSTFKSLAKHFNCGEGTVDGIVNGRSWKHLLQPGESPKCNPRKYLNQKIRLSARYTMNR